MSLSEGPKPQNQTGRGQPASDGAHPAGSGAAVRSRQHRLQRHPVEPRRTHLARPQPSLHLQLQNHLLLPPALQRRESNHHRHSQIPVFLRSHRTFVSGTGSVTDFLHNDIVQNGAVDLQARV